MSEDSDTRRIAEDWWRTSIIEMQPNHISIRGRPIEELIGQVDFPEMVWLMLRGETPTSAQARLLTCAMVASVDHGPQAPSIAIARMAATCGVDINGAVASGVNALGNIHGGAGQQALEIFEAVVKALGNDKSDELHVMRVVDDHVARAGKYLPGFGHRFHKIDPRVPRLGAIVDSAVRDGVVSGGYLRVARAIQTRLLQTRSAPVPMNIDGITAVIYGELGFEPVHARGIFILARAVGILAHAIEQGRSNERSKGPLPRQWTWTYAGPADQKMDGT